MSQDSGLRELKRFVTTHNDEGKAIFSDAVPEDNPLTPMKPDDSSIKFALSYVCEGFPIELNGDEDIKTYKGYLENAPGLAIGNGQVLRHVDFAPGLKHVMHRTVSIDYGIVLEGETYCVLDSGERRHMKRGDVCIQRGTSHLWENASKTEWCRMVFVLSTCKPIEVAGKKLELDMGSMAE